MSGKNVNGERNSEFAIRKLSNLYHSGIFFAIKIVVGEPFSKYFWQECQRRRKFEFRNPPMMQPLSFGYVFLSNQNMFGKNVNGEGNMKFTICLLRNIYNLCMFFAIRAFFGEFFFSRYFLQECQRKRKFKIQNPQIKQLLSFVDFSK